MHRFRRFIPVLLLVLILRLPALADELVIPPQWPVPDYVTALLQVASAEVGYTEGEHGRTKYGEWAGDPYCQWCAEFQCWCVDQVDQQYGTELLNHVYPRYSASNTGRSWFIRAGRYVVRKGQVDGWGYEWLQDHETVLSSGDYIPQPGDWVFFTWTGDENTDHVALVEYCTQNTQTGEILIHVIEGNKPSAVARDVYSIHYSRILGYGAVHDVIDITMQFGNQGEKVSRLQEKLIYLGYLRTEKLDGRFGDATAEAVRTFQTVSGLRVTGIANQATQLMLNQQVRLKTDSDPAIWTVIDEDEEEN